MKKYIFGLITIFAASCWNKTSNITTDIFEQITTTNEGGIIRGAELGMNTSTIKSNEIRGLTENDTTYLFYEFVIDSTSNYTVAYSFENDSLNEIRMDVYLQNEKNAADLSAKLKTYFFNKYHVQPQNESEAMWIWAVNEKSGNALKIELADESADYDFKYGKISLMIYKEDNREQPAL